MKLYRKVGTWVMLAFLVVALILASILTTFIGEKMDEKQLQANIEQGKMVLTQPGMPKHQKESIEKEVHLLELSLKNKVSFERVQVFLFAVKKLLPLITCLLVIVAANIVSKEFSDGTIKLLLIRPVSRSFILFSKYATVLISAAGMLLIHFIVSSAMCNLLFKPALYPFISKELFAEYGYSVIVLILVATLAFMISTVFRSQGLAIGLTLFLVLTGDLIVQFLARFFSGTKYLLFANLDLSRSYEGIDSTMFPGFEGITTSFSVKVIVVYYLVFLCTTWYAFNKRDVSI